MKKWLFLQYFLLIVFFAAALYFIQTMRSSIDRLADFIVAGHNASKAGSPFGKTPSFVGYVRGRSRTILKNKYAGFVSKVNFYSHRRVKKGDTILEYDDLPLRTSIEKIEHSIAEQQKVLDQKKLKLELTRLDPLPSEYRNLYWKLKIAQENFERSAHEFNVYRRLHNSKIVTDLAYREKKEAFKNSEAEVKKMDSDMKILQKGLADYYIKSAEMAVLEAEIKLKDLKEELARLQEERKYYKITAPYDGLCITNSDVVHGYDTAGTNAAEVHRDDRKLIYSMCPEKFIHLVKEGEKYPFISNQYADPKLEFELLCFEVKRTQYSYGDECYYLVKFRLVKEPRPLRINSVGTIEIRRLTSAVKPAVKPPVPQETGKKE